jgi:hypothetical protein
MANKFSDQTSASLNKLVDNAISKIQAHDASLRASLGDKFNPEVALLESALILDKTPHEALAGMAALALRRLATFANSKALPLELADLDFIPGDGEGPADGD